MSDDTPDVPHLLASQHVLDDLDLIRAGVEVPVASIALETLDSLRSVSVSHVVLVEPEGVPVATLGVRSISGTTDRYCLDAPVQFMARRPDRPFEALHRGIAALRRPDVTIVLDHAVAPEELADHVPAGATVLLLIVASVERDGETEPRDIEVCQRSRDLSHDLRDERFALGHVDTAIVPIARDHPHREERIQACSTAYSQGGLVADLTRPAEQSPGPNAGGVLFFTGLSGSGKSTLAKAVRNRILESSDRRVTLLDGDGVRRHLSSGLGFSPQDRDLNIRRIGWVASRIAEHGGLAICSPIAPFEATRLAVQEMTTRTGARFLLVHVSTPLQECERRDRKGLYARARRGEIADFTGISSPYQEPTNPDLRLDTTGQDVDQLVEHILDLGHSQSMWPRMTRL